MFGYQFAEAPSRQAIMTSNKSIASIDDVGRSESGFCSDCSDRPWRSRTWGMISGMWWTPWWRGWGVGVVQPMPTR